MELIFLLLIIAFPLWAYFRDAKKYKETTYYKSTKNPYSLVRRDKGRHGEYLIYQCLQDFESKGGKFLFNVYVPKANGTATEIDVIMLCSKGVFVFESKNFSGWIFGHERHTHWTQTLPVGPGRSHKERFYNPVMQNAAHIRHLKRVIGHNLHIQSIIVFSDRCRLKKVTVTNPDVRIVTHRNVSYVMSQIASDSYPDLLTASEIDDIYTKLYFHTGAIAASRHIAERG